MGINVVGIIRGYSVKKFYNYYFNLSLKVLTHLGHLEVEQVIITLLVI